MTLRRAGFVGLLAVSCAVGGCDACGSSSSSSSTSSGTSSPASGSTSAAPPSSSTWRTTLKARGSAGKIFRAVQALTLNEEQQANLSKIGSDLQAAELAAKGAEQDAGFVKGELKAAHADIVEGVRAGAVDLAKLSAHEAALARADEARHRREADALNRAQRVLEPAQRSAVAAAVRGASKPAFGRDAQAPDAKAPATPPPPPLGSASSRPLRDGGAARRPGEVNWARARYESYLANLGLDAEQEKKVNAILDGESVGDTGAEEVARLEALVDAFEKDGFDANRFAFGDPKDGRGPLFRLGRFLAKVVPILKPEQHQKLATKLIDADAVPKRQHGGTPHPSSPDGDDE